MMYCRVCSEENIRFEPALKCAECGHCLAFCKCPEYRDDSGEFFGPEYKSVLDMVCQNCGAVGGHCESVRYDEDCDAA